MPATCRHVVVLMHGSHGSPRDLRCLADCLVKQQHRTTAQTASLPIAHRSLAFDEVELHIVAPHIKNTDKGIAACADELRATLAKWIQSVSAPSQTCSTTIISGVGHSLGGILLRSAMSSLADTFGIQSLSQPPSCGGAIYGGALFTVATPHCGAVDMPNRCLAAAGRSVAALGGSVTYADLFLKTQALEINDAATLDPWRPFSKVCLVAEVHDQLVSCSSATLRTQSHIEIHRALKWKTACGTVRSFVPSLATSASPSTLTEPLGPPDALLVSRSERIRRRLLLRQSSMDEVWLVDLGKADAVSSCSEYATSFSVSKMNNAWMRQLAHRYGSHRAVVCKKPFDDMHSYGYTSELIASQLHQVEKSCV